MIDDSIRKEPTETLKSISEAPPVKKVVKKEEKLTPEGLRPGERLDRWLFLIPGLSLFTSYFLILFNISRFKQLKEQEERRRKQREEERRKVEAAARGIQITNGKVNKEITSEETSSTNIDGFSVNGNSVNTKMKVDEGASTDSEVSKEKSDILDDSKNGRSSLHLDKNIEKVLLSFFICELFCFCY